MDLTEILRKEYFSDEEFKADYLILSESYVPQITPNLDYKGVIVEYTLKGGFQNGNI